MSDVTKASDLRAKTDAELAEELLNLRKEQFNLRMQRATGQLSRPDQFAKVRRSIAQVKTIAAERASGKVIEPKAAKPAAKTTKKVVKKVTKKVAKKATTKKTGRAA